MKILYVITALGVGGAEMLLYEECKYLKQQGHDMRVAYLLGNHALVKLFDDAGIETVFIDTSGNGFFKSIFDLKSLINDFKPNVVHTHLVRADSLGRIAGLLAHDKKIKIFSTMHNVDSWKRDNKLPYKALRLFNKMTVNLFSNVQLIAVSDTVKNYCISYEHIKPDKITTVYNAIRFEPTMHDSNNLYGLKEDDFVIVNIGRLEEQKSQITLLRSAAHLIMEKGYKNLKVFICGDGSLRDEFSKFIEFNHLSTNIFLTGFQQNTSYYLGLADLFVFPSKYEGFGLALFEAFHGSVPVLASDILALREIIQDIDSDACVFFEMGNVRALANEIVKFMNDEYDVEAMVESARRIAGSFSMSRHIDSLITTYTKDDLNKNLP